MAFLDMIRKAQKYRGLAAAGLKMLGHKKFARMIAPKGRSRRRR
jgi:hypothetical protein